MIDNEMAEAEARARKVHKSAGPAGVERMVNGARARILEKRLGIKAHYKKVDTPAKQGPFQTITDSDATIEVKPGQSVTV